MDLAPSPASSWPQPPEAVTLGRDEVHVWRAALDRTASDVQNLERTLVAEELRRADRYRFQTDRDHFVVARGLLRTILGRYLHMPPAEVRFRCGAQGKPALSEPLRGEMLHFNVSHSHALALFGISRRRELGIDLEYIRADLAGDQLVERMFAPGEVAASRALPPEARREAFFTCWSRKEAFLKATGHGLARPLDEFEVSLDPEDPVVVLRSPRDHLECQRWSLRDLAVGPRYAAALCVEGHDWRLTCWQWPES